MVSSVPHSVLPLPQLFIVPRVLVPLGENLVTNSGLPRAGPDSSISVVPVMRRLKAESTATSKTPWAFFLTSATVTPWQSTSMSTSPAGRGLAVGPLACSTQGVMYSWFMASRARSLPLSSRIPLADKP